VWLLWRRFFLQTIRIVRFKILRLKVEKEHFILIFVLHAIKNIFEAQYSPQWSWNFRGLKNIEFNLKSLYICKNSIDSRPLLWTVWKLPLAVVDLSFVSYECPRSTSGNHNLHRMWQCAPHLQLKLHFIWEQRILQNGPKCNTKEFKRWQPLTGTPSPLSHCCVITAISPHELSALQSKDFGSSLTANLAIYKKCYCKLLRSCFLQGV
jgi:hypothetical protein